MTWLILAVIAEVSVLVALDHEAGAGRRACVSRVAGGVGCAQVG